jgi:hypothetical protein
MEGAANQFVAELLKKEILSQSTPFQISFDAIASDVNECDNPVIKFTNRS